MTRAAKGKILVNNLIGGKVLDNTARADDTGIVYKSSSDTYIHQPYPDTSAPDIPAGTKTNSG